MRRTQIVLLLMSALTAFLLVGCDGVGAEETAKTRSKTATVSPVSSGKSRPKVEASTTVAPAASPAVGTMSGYSIEYKGNRYEISDLPEVSDARAADFVKELVDTGDRLSVDAGGQAIYVRKAFRAEDEIWMIQEATRTYDPDRKTWVKTELSATRFVPVER